MNAPLEKRPIKFFLLSTFCSSVRGSAFTFLNAGGLADALGLGAAACSRDFSTWACGAASATSRLSRNASPGESSFVSMGVCVTISGDGLVSASIGGASHAKRMLQLNASRQPGTRTTHRCSLNPFSKKICWTLISGQRRVISRGGKLPV